MDTPTARPGRCLGVWAALATLTLSVAGAAPAAAQSPAGEQAVEVEGTAVCVLKTAGTVTHAAGVTFLDDQVARCTLDASDPRVSGDSTMTIDAQVYGGPGRTGAMWLWFELTGPDGSWAGPEYGVVDAAGNNHDIGFAVGSGAYEGWTLAYRVDTASMKLTGVIYPGSPPPGFPMTSPVESVSGVSPEASPAM